MRLRFAKAGEGAAVFSRQCWRSAIEHDWEGELRALNRRVIGLVRIPPIRPLAREAAARARALAPYGDDREILALLFLPFLLMASAIGISQSMRNGTALPPIASHMPHAVPEAHPKARRDLPAPSPAAPVAAGPLLPSEAPTPAIPPVATAPEMAVPASPAHPGEIALLNPVPLPATPPASLGSIEIAPEIPSEIAARDAPADALDPAARGICVAEAKASAPEPSRLPASLDPAEFGRRLAAAALTQLDEFVIYNDKYRNISFPMGDVSPLFGVCTDVVVRAYRALGIDLQELVHEERSGSGDSNIDHRRTEVLRRFFASKGTSLPPSDYAEDYKAGDIVTYYRPQNQGSRSHIAIVADRIAPSGRPMIIHNRGWGPQMEDALFVDEITGHYRYAGATVLTKAAEAGAAATTEEDASYHRAPAVRASFARPARHAN